MNTLFSLKFLRGSVLALALGCSSCLGAWEQGDSLPDLAAFSLEGDIPEFVGKVTYVDFWASWCAPCKASFPEMERLYQENKDAGFQVLAVSVDSSEKAMQKFLDRAQPSFSVVWDAKQSLVADAEVEVMPTSFLVDAKGVIRAVHYGWRGGETVEELESEITELLQELGK
ncbi:TlpA disulfide reductase family protein [Pelagicoccus sp. SDUM812002]|uniref:TlpA family protein disulfide reductase n=1 Tax=Pelagicoccus sp. SDUM812002 TaxID=3041266 RepID=UPI00280F9280|nr:TlpA disulfide reductase family protein [Pelagicoccus sp. SDUM812002]MDQ8186517.1 TlpA disulfide reductase family protein [Pelagicoccus sp. SDUM812002]